MSGLIQYEDPFWGLSSLQREVDSLFQDFLRQRDRELISWAPSCDVEETEGHYLLKFDLPGINKEDVQIEMRENQLVVSGERKREESEKKGTRHFTERTYGSFTRAFTLPTAVDRDRIEASYKDGVLRIALPKAESSKPRRVEIKDGVGSVFKKILGGTQEEKTPKAA